MTKPNFNVDFRSKYPKLTENINGEEIELTAEAYEETIRNWEIAQAEAKAKYEAEQAAIQAKAALLERLGITEEEAKLLLG